MSTMAGATSPHAAAPSPAASLADEHQTLLKYEAILRTRPWALRSPKTVRSSTPIRAFGELFGWGRRIGGPTWPRGGSSDADYAEAGASRRTARLAMGPVNRNGTPDRSPFRQDHMVPFAKPGRWIRRLPRRVARSWIIEDVAERRQAVDALRTLNDELENRVKERTAELEQANARRARSKTGSRPEARAQHLALRCADTACANRRLLNDRLVQSLAQTKRETWQLAVMFIDLDRFKRQRHARTFGGRRVLREIAVA